MSQIQKPSDESPDRMTLVVLIAGCSILLVSFGILSSFGLFLEPISTSRGWPRETFALALAIQNLTIGLFAPISGAIADRLGAKQAIFIGGLCFAIGIWGIPNSDTQLSMMIFAGLLVGIGLAFTTFSVVLSTMAKFVPIERRSLVLGLGTSVGSFGQVLFTPVGQAFISAYGWQTALLILATTALAILPAALMIPRNQTKQLTTQVEGQTLPEALTEASTHRGYVLLISGFFVCGFHVAFITVHFPAYVLDLGLSAQTGAYALALIGFFNIIGSFCSGLAGQRWPKKRGLSIIYICRALAITALILAPKSNIVILLFASVMGILWLSTVPLTSGIVAQIFGVRFMATLFGIVQLSHQTGAFIGAWLGGRLFDTTGSYDVVWWIAVGLGVIAALIHIPINEQPLPRLTMDKSIGR